MGSVPKDKLRRYLKQTRELFGDELYLNLPSRRKTHPVEQPNTFSHHSHELDAFREKINTCQKCSLGATRNQFVFGVGDPRASLMLVGEAPGAEEDLKGEPFVGRAGKLLDDILKAIQRTRQNDVFICNVLKCRPPKNRDPKPEEVELCEPYLIHQISLIKPKLIVALGRIAGKTLLGVEEPLKTMRNTLHHYHGTPLVVTYHPAALLRNRHWKPAAWKDFQWIRDILNNT